MKSRKKIAVAASVLGLIAAVFLWPHFHAKWAVESYRKKLIRQGEKLTLAGLVPSAPANGSNGAPQLLAAAAQLRSWGSNDVSVAERAGPGIAIVGWKMEILPNLFKTNVWPGLAKEMAAKQTALAQARAALADPVLYFQLDYDLMPNLPITHLAPLKSSANNLEQAAMLGLHEGDYQTAFENLRALTRLAANFGGDESPMINQLVRIAIQQIAVAATWEALQYPGWSDDQLAELQKLWESFQLLPMLEPTFEMERLFAIMTFDKVSYTFDDFQSVKALQAADSGNSSRLVNELGLDGFMDRLRYESWKRSGHYWDELSELQSSQAFIEAIRAAMADRAFSPAAMKLDETLAKAGVSSPDPHSMLIGSGLKDVFKKFILKIVDMEMERRLVVTAIALNRFRLKHGEYPEKLDALAPDILASVPSDPMDGKPLRYRRNPEGSFLLYSVGEDGIDNGGDPEPPAHAALSWWQARDAVWPRPATPAEAGAHSKTIHPAKSK